MPIDHTALLAGSPDEVLAVLTDEVFLRDVARSLGAQLQGVSAEESDDGPRTAVRLLVPTTGVPSVFARFVGREVAVVDRRSWTRSPDGAHRGLLDVQAEVFGRSVAVRGERRLAAVDDGTRSTVTGEAEVDAPFVGRQAEAAVRELALVVLRREDEVLRRWLASPA
ncbi:DUF2505 domain-containing protein [Geodermatophilus marinus]|uniref:DUF2505 domain-containing protein n=1 Tax=Geodermatophilus sp. LHW52908 TaxID=2303986 RepID=UPI000E3BA21F|nr:DUF2505 domain-containing protein [Geodermatophilus sp. LHW52908]RFU22096.1 DUF2505 domain-containing protein [Geodermatophilus sp. LHW52908]